MRRKRRERQPPAKQVRCASYTRKSTEEGLEQDFNTLDAQREIAENYIASQKAEGWVCLPDRYDDGGFTGGNMERPALQRLLADIDAGELERFVVDQIRGIGRDPNVLAETIRQVRLQSQKAIAELEREQRALERDIARRSKALKRASAAAGGPTH